MTRLPLSSDTRRRVTAAARLLLSDKPGEVAGAVNAIGRMLPGGLTVPDLIEQSLKPPTSAVPAVPPHRFGSWQQQARMARSCPHLNDWERGFLRSIVLCSSLTAKQESALRAILRKAEELSQ